MRLTIAMFAALLMAVAGVRAAAPEKTYKPDDEGFIKNWVVADPVQLDEKAGNHDEENQKDFFARDYVKKADETPKAGDKLKAGDKELAWKAEEASDYFVDCEKIGSDRGKGTENTLWIGVTYVWCDAEVKDAKLTIGSDDSSVWWLNGKEVVRVYSGRAVEKDQDTSSPLTLKQGRNLLRFALINGGGPTGACARFTNAGGTPIKNVKISVDPGN